MLGACDICSSNYKLEIVVNIIIINEFPALVNKWKNVSFNSWSLNRNFFFREKWSKIRVRIIHG